MAGFQGMGTPQALQASVPVEPQVNTNVQLPPMQAPAQQMQPTPTEVDPLDALIQEHASAAPVGADPLDALIQEHGAVAEPAPPSKRDILDYALDAGKGLVGYAGKGLHLAGNVLDRLGPAEIRGGVGALIDKTQGKDTSVIDEMLSGAIDPSAVPTGKQLVEKVNPELANSRTVKVKSGVVELPALDEYLKKNSTQAEYAKYKKESNEVNYTPSTLMGIAADFASGTLAAKGLKALPAISKFATAVAEHHFEKTIAAERAALGAEALTPVRQAEVAAQGLAETTASVENIAAKLPLTPNQVNLRSATEQEIAKSLSNNVAIQAMKKKQGEDAVNALLKQSEAFANIEPKAGGVPKVFQTLHEAADSQGRIIGKFRTAAKEAAGSGRLPIQNFESKLKEFVDQAGFIKAGDKLQRPNIEDMAVNMKISQDEAKELMPYLERYAGKVYNSTGRMTYGEIENLYQKDVTLLAKMLDKNPSGSSKHYAFELRKAIGEDMLTSTGTVLAEANPAVMSEYKTAMDAYSKTKNSQESIKQLMKRGDMTSDNVVQYFMDAGAAGADKGSAMRDILMREDPELMRDMSGAFMNRLMFKNKELPTANSPMPYNFKGIKNDITKLAGTDGKMLDILTGSPEKSKDLRQLVDNLEKLHEGTYANKPVIKDTFMGRTLYLASKLGAPKEMLAEALKMPTRDFNINRYLKSVNAEELLKVAPPKERVQMMNYIRTLSNTVSDNAEEDLPQGYQKQPGR